MLFQQCCRDLLVLARVGLPIFFTTYNGSSGSEMFHFQWLGRTCRTAHDQLASEPAILLAILCNGNAVVLRGLGLTSRGRVERRVFLRVRAWGTCVRRIASFDQCSGCMRHATQGKLLSQRNVILEEKVGIN